MAHLHIDGSSQPPNLPIDRSGSLPERRGSAERSAFLRRKLPEKKHAVTVEKCNAPLVIQAHASVARARGVL